jgi:hypothetical protein
MCFNTHNIPTGVSDCHNLISTTIKGNLPVQDKRKCIYSHYENNVKIILDKHAPLKTRYPRKNPLPCMNSTLTKAIHRVHMLCSNYTKQRNGRTWKKYRKQRNLVNKLKKNSTKNYFLERCSGGAKSCDFWKTMKPFFSKKSNSGEQKIIQNEKQQNCKRYQTSYRTFQYFFSLL